MCAYENHEAVITALLKAHSECSMHKWRERGNGTTEVYDACYVDLCTHGKQLVLGGRSCMRVSAWSMNVMSHSLSLQSLMPLPQLSLDLPSWSIVSLSTV